MKTGDTIELTQDTDFYKKGQRAKVINVCDNAKDIEIRYEGERYARWDVDVMPKALFKIVKK